MFGPLAVGSSYKVTFRWPATEAEVVVSASHVSSQCRADIHNVEVDPDYVRFIAQ